jgi:hypothetical protein
MSGENPRSPLSHKDTGATLRASLGRRRAVRLIPMCPSTTPAEPVQHIWVISTPVDSPVDKSAVDGKTTRSGRERTVGVDGG